MVMTPPSCDNLKSTSNKRIAKLKDKEEEKTNNLKRVMLQKDKAQVMASFNMNHLKGYEQQSSISLHRQMTPSNNLKHIPLPPPRQMSSNLFDQESI